MDKRIFQKLLHEELITPSEFEKIALQEREPVSVHWDLRTLLYLGIVLLTTALGILVYKNIDTIGHAFIIIFIGIVCTGCFWYCFKNAQKYSHEKITAANIWFDYILLLGCILLLTFIGYLQFEYNVFGNRWGLATFIPMILLFMAAYYFDHLGVLSIAIVNLAAWAGISVTPSQVLSSNDFGSISLIYSGLVLGSFLVAVSFASVYHHIKAHFYFTYKNFGCHILLISLLAATFNFERFYFLWFLALSVACFFLYRNAFREKSFYFLVVSILYAYIGLSYVVVRLLFTSNMEAGAAYLGIFYFIFSGIGFIVLLIRLNKKLKVNDGI
ncbi:MAG: DUF2157 domain-containing protein [Ginsengibacter sp.]